MKMSKFLLFFLWAFAFMNANAWEWKNGYAVYDSSKHIRTHLQSDNTYGNNLGLILNFQKMPSGDPWATLTVIGDKFLYEKDKDMISVIEINGKKTQWKGPVMPTSDKGEFYALPYKKLLPAIRHEKYFSITVPLKNKGKTKFTFSPNSALKWPEPQ